MLSLLVFRLKFCVHFLFILRVLCIRQSHPLLGHRNII